MRNRRIAVEQLSDAMATVIVVYEEAVGIADVAHPIANVPHVDVRLDYS